MNFILEVLVKHSDVDDGEHFILNPKIFSSFVDVLDAIEYESKWQGRALTVKFDHLTIELPINFKYKYESCYDDLLFLNKLLSSDDKQWFMYEYYIRDYQADVGMTHYLLDYTFMYDSFEAFANDALGIFNKEAIDVAERQYNDTGYGYDSSDVFESYAVHDVTDIEIDGKLYYFCQVH